jgi:hypothetical protein
MFRVAIVVFALALVAAAPAAARFYKWVDDDGTTHYSQNRPPDRQAQEMSLESSRTSGIGGGIGGGVGGGIGDGIEDGIEDGNDCRSLTCRAARLDADRAERERAAQEQRDKAARAAAAGPVFPSHVEETDEEKITRLVAQCEKSRGSKCDSDEEKRRMLLQHVDLTQAERRALRGLSPASQRRALEQRIPKQYRDIE